MYRSEPRQFRKLLAPAVLAATAVVALAGCGSSGRAAGAGDAATVTASGAAASGGGSASPTGAGVAATPTGGGTVTCTQVTAAELDPIASGVVQAPTVTAAGVNSSGQQCEYPVGDGDSFDLLVESGTAASTGYAQEYQGATNPVSVPGVGDKAFRDGDDDQIDAMQGSTFCSVTLGDDETIKGVGAIELANGGTDNLSQADDSIIAAALGTYCNRIFGSGNTTPSLTGLQ